jgi:hypothetical protein
VDISVGIGPITSIIFDGNTIMHILVRFWYCSQVSLGSGSLGMVIFDPFQVNVGGLKKMDMANGKQ